MYVANVGRWLDRKGDTEIVRLRFGWIDILQTNIMLSSMLTSG